MSEQDSGMAGGRAVPGDEYRLKETAAALNDRLGLYLSEEQQRGLATGLLVGAALGSAILVWGIIGSLRRG